MDTRWFVYEGGKVRRGKSVHNSTAITQEARRMLGCYWLEKRGGKATPKTSAPPAMNRATKPTPAPEQQTAKDKILTLLQNSNSATTAEMIKASGWQAHSVRAFLSRLRKKHTIVTSQARNLLYYQLKSAQG